MVNSGSKVLTFNRNNLDSILALIGAILAIALIAYLQIRTGNPAYTITAVLTFIACVAYLVLKWRRRLFNIPSILNFEAKPSILLLADIAFFAIFIYSLWSFMLRPEPYVRPLEYFISIAAMSAILAAKILFLPSQNSRTPLTLFQIILIALSLEWSVLLLFPDIVGIDPFYHQLVTLDMLNKLHLGAGYQNLPAMHLIIGSISLITGLSYKMATMFSISTLQVVCDILFIFLIGRLLFNDKAGLLAALLVGIANWHIFFSYWTIPNTLGATLVIIILYLVLKLHKDRTNVMIPLSGLLMVTVLLTHAMATLWLAILLFAFWLVFVFYKKLFEKKLATRYLLTMALSFTIVMLLWWTFGTGHIRTLAFLTERGFEPTASLTYAPATAPSAITLPEAAPPAWETLSGAPFEFLFNSLGMFLFFAMSFIGCFYMLSRGFGNPYAFFIAVAGVFILGIGYFPMLAGRSFIEHRWWYQAEILLSIPLAVTFFLLSGLFKKRYFMASLTIVLIFILSFLSIIGFPSNQTQRTFSKNQVVRFAFTASETQALQTVSANYEKTIGVDGNYALVGLTPELLTGLKGKLAGTQHCLLTKDFSGCSSNIILIRAELVNNPFGTGSGCYYKLNYDPRQVLAEQGFHKVYDCGSVSGFSR